MEKLLEINNLKTYFNTAEGIVRAVDGVDLSVGAGRTLALAGESGCGKSVTALSVLRLVQHPGKIVGGEIIYKGSELLKLSEDGIRKIRGKEISMIFQDPFTSLNPVFTVGNQIEEAIKVHIPGSAKNREAARRAVEMLSLVELPSPENIYHYYPHQLSGGMQQRAMIAMALATNPSLLIADEPTTALDITIQAQILDLLERLRQKFNMSVMLITHNLGIIDRIADDVAIMYLGRIMECSEKNEFFKTLLHPYTRGLLDAVPKIREKKKLYVIPGSLPSPLEIPQGCRFNPRCEKKMEICGREEPALKEISPGHTCRCWLY